ncbi:TPA: hypothetical protein QCR36_003965 [Bacillus cereus]|nr:hypothetical protein [Bacillus cereus]HDR4742434.1 hypothetical protein [Bacillus cereus]HDR4748021.1 hypothetical protein [Bacillus cereus]HDR4753495.1 hypothetical protein [Bacillus cereus]HDR4770704.1 hypothetical protein [Bacillus cereus]
MSPEKKYRVAKGKITDFILREIDNGEISEEEIAKILIEISLSYLKYPVINKQAKEGV